MKMTLIYPRWPKLERQTEFHLPPHGPVVFAAAVPEEIELEFVDENRQTVDFDQCGELVALSVMLTAQLPRAFEIAAEFRARQVPVIFGGIAVMLHSEEVALHADAVFLGEAEGRFQQVIDDFRAGRLRKLYDYMGNPPDISLVGTARRDILKRDLYNYRGVQMLDLVHASRGCKFNCFPCCTGYLGGRRFRPRPIDKVIEELESIRNNRLFVVDNSLAQDRQWLKELFTAMAPLKKKWVSHPILDDDEILKLAADAGAWYVYQAVFDTSDVIRNRVRRLKEHGIGVEGTIILGTDDQDEDYIKRLVDFLMEIELDVAEFTILTPFPHSPIRAQYEKEGRILSNDWSRYTADKVVFRPKRMSPERLQELYYYAWETFYAGGGHQLKMGELFKRVVKREMEDGTFRRYDPKRRRGFQKQREAMAE
ncbi:MAG: radical SAM protein [Deltaproteobacteria bacterium]|nr:radical SAM protein [Deltaproteobacteria bacterium]